jgi:hypothetical protein
MFAPIAVDNVAFPESSSLSTFDFLPESFDAFQAYSNTPTSSTFSSQSFTPTPTINAIQRYGMGPNNQILSISDSNNGTVYKWDANTDTMTTHGTQSIGNVRNILWDNVTNSWVLFGTSAFVKISCDNLAVSSSITVPTNQGTGYAAGVAYGGKVYALPVGSTGTNTAVAIFDLVTNTATTASVPVGISTTNAFWGACLTSVGTIYFGRDTAVTNQSIYEYNPQTGTGTLFGTLGGSSGYGMLNLPNGNVFIPVLGINQTVYIVNPVNKAIQTIATAGFGFRGGICVGQNGHPYGIQSGTASGGPGIWGFNTTTNRGYLTQYTVPSATSGDRGYQDFFSLADGRLIGMPVQNNSGRLTYWTYLQNPRNNTFSPIGAANPIMQNSKGI